MRRDYFELSVEHVDWVETGGDPEEPLVRIDFTGPDNLLESRLTGIDGDLLEADEIDVAFRLQEPLEQGGDAAGVVAVTNRLTGDFILELNETADDVRRFIEAAAEYADSSGEPEGRYRIEVLVNGEPLVGYEKGTFLVYDSEGSLLRTESLIPSGVEL